MSLLSTLGTMAATLALAKGAGSLMNKSGGGGAGGGLGGLLGGVLGGGGGAAGGLGSLLGGGAAGGLGSLLGGGASGGSSGGLGGLLEGMSGGAAPAANAQVQAPSSGSLGHLLNGALNGEKIPEPEPAQEDQAAILILAMVNAAKSDGKIDETEQQKLVSNLGDEVSEEERQFVMTAMQAPFEPDAFIKSIPAGAGPQVYMMSVLAIDLDTPAEAQYLDKLRKGVDMSEQDANAIHQQLGVPSLYS